MEIVQHFLSLGLDINAKDRVSVQLPFCSATSQECRKPEGIHMPLCAILTVTLALGRGQCPA